MKRIVTSFVYPPIPVRNMDWCAYAEGEEELGHYGHGETEAEATADFIATYPDDAEDADVIEVNSIEAAAAIFGVS